MMAFVLLPHGGLSYLYRELVSAKQPTGPDVPDYLGFVLLFPFVLYKRPARY